jgi:hypothetical protein
MFPVPKVQEHYDEEGNAIDKEAIHKRAKYFVGELIWLAQAKQKMEV